MSPSKPKARGAVVPRNEEFDRQEAEKQAKMDRLRKAKEAAQVIKDKGKKSGSKGKEKKKAAEETALEEAEAKDDSELSKKLPTLKTEAHKKKRDEMFLGFDPNGNGFLSLAEIDKGCRDVLQCDEIFDAKPAIIRA